MATRKYHRKTNKFRKTKRKNRKSKKTSKRFSNKRVRKIRSKRQRGGNDEMNKYFFDAIVIDALSRIFPQKFSDMLGFLHDRVMRKRIENT